MGVDPGAAIWGLYRETPAVLPFPVPWEARPRPTLRLQWRRARPSRGSGLARAAGGRHLRRPDRRLLLLVGLEGGRLFRHRLLPRRDRDLRPARHARLGGAAADHLVGAAGGRRRLGRDRRLDGDRDPLVAGPLGRRRRRLHRLRLRGDLRCRHARHPDARQPFGGRPGAGRGGGHRGRHRHADHPGERHPPVRLPPPGRHPALPLRLPQRRRRLLHDRHLGAALPLCLGPRPVAAAGADDRGGDDAARADRALGEPRFGACGRGGAARLPVRQPQPAAPGRLPRPGRDPGGNRSAAAAAPLPARTDRRLVAARPLRRPYGDLDYRPLAGARRLRHRRGRAAPADRADLDAADLARAGRRRRPCRGRRGRRRARRQRRPGALHRPAGARVRHRGQPCLRRSQHPLRGQRLLRAPGPLAGRRRRVRSTGRSAAAGRAPSSSNTSATAAPRSRRRTPTASRC